MDAQLVVGGAVDISECEREPIHVSGAIQSHGLLFGVDDVELRIVHLSENTNAFFGIAARELIGLSIEAVLGFENTELIHDAVAGQSIEDGNPRMMTVPTLLGDVVFDVVLHRSGPEIVVELEPSESASSTSLQRFYESVRVSMAHLDRLRGIVEICDAGVAELRALTGFDRVMAYRFDDDWNGEVIAERCSSVAESFLGLHYPASDIPRQARELYTRNWLRFVPDIRYVPANIVASAEASDFGPLDLSQSILRSVSPVHLEYLRNMGVAATMSVSLLKNGRLWGLLACHHLSPRQVPYSTRLACEIMGRTISLHLGSREEMEDVEYRSKVKAIQIDLVEALATDGNIARAMTSDKTKLLDLLSADGAVVVYGNEYAVAGRVPERRDVAALVAWLDEREDIEPFFSDALPVVQPQFAALVHIACGIFALPLTASGGNYILWFRPEVESSVNWGGDPNKPVEISSNGVARISPRKSFSLWKEIVRNHSRRWTRVEVEAAVELRRLLTMIIGERAADLDRVIRQLNQRNDELNSFAHVASHDLKEPLRGIHNYANYLLEDYGTLLDDPGREKLNTVVRLSQRLEQLIESLLQLSRIGYTSPTRVPSDVVSAVADVTDLYLPQLRDRGGSVKFVPPLGMVLVDMTLLRKIFENLISNAIKYCERAPEIEIGVAPSHVQAAVPQGAAPALLSQRPFITMYVRDNGIGIREEHLVSIFQMFKRLHAVNRYGGGSGAGLAFVRKIIERHDGTVWAESQFGSGTTIYFTLPEAVEA
jgi:chemotaxis family two-component system sensor kinase Cph1